MYVFARESLENLLVSIATQGLSINPWSTAKTLQYKREFSVYMYTKYILILNAASIILTEYCNFYLCHDLTDISCDDVTDNPLFLFFLRLYYEYPV